MKKCALYGLLPVVLVAGATTASANMHERCAFNGFYAGLGTGVQVTTGHAALAETATFSLPAGGPLRVTASNFTRGSLKKSAWAGAVFLGYGCAWDCIYLGAEATYKYARARARNSSFTTVTIAVPGTPTDVTGVSQTVAARLRPSEFDLDLRPGVMLSPRTLLYGRVGMAFNRTSVAFVNTFTGNQSPVPFSVFSLSNGGAHRKNSVGLRLGAGMEHEFCNHVAIRAEYTWARFQRVTVVRTASVSPTNNFNTSSVVGTAAARARLSSHTVMLGLAYYW